MPERLVSQREFADLLGVDAGTFRNWRCGFRVTTPPIPEPDGFLGPMPYWRVTTVEKYLHSREDGLLGLARLKEKKARVGR